MKQKNIFLSVVALFMVMNMHAQPGTIDATFNSVDSGFWKGNTFNGGVSASFLQKDGKFIIAGSFSKFNDTKATRITRFNADGTIDPTFNNTGTGANTIQKVISQPDGKIFIAGAFTIYNGIARKGVARLNTDGSLDNTFDPGSGLGLLGSYNQTMVLQSDGKIIVGGSFKSFNGITAGNVVRINPDGKQDTTFHIGTGFNARIFSMVLQNDGKVIISGSFTSYNAIPCNFLVRLNPGGSLDNTFNTGGSGPDSQASSILLQDDGKILITGTFKNYNGSTRNGIARLNADGTLDNTFAVSAGTFTGTLLETCKQTDGKIIVSEALTTAGASRGWLVRLNAGGTVDNSFYELGVNNNVRTFFQQSDGKIIAGGTFTNCNGILRNYIARLNADGSIDKNVFNVVGKGLNGELWASAVQNDGKILIGGFFTSYNGKERMNMARLHTDGSLDTTFNTTGTGTNNGIECIVPQADGKILVGGWFKSYNGVTRGGLVRLNSDGSLDTTLKSDPGFDASVEHISVQADGKIILCGDFVTYNGIPANNILRLHPNGSLDTTFKPKTGATQLIWRTLIQPDGKIVLGGHFGITNGTTIISNIARLNPNGSVDTSFHCGNGADNSIFALGLQKDGKIIIGGQFKMYNGLPTNNVARLNANGTLDNTFNSGSGINSGPTIWTLAIQDNGKIIAGGNFNSFNGTAANSLVRLNSDGTLDNVFKNTLGATNKVISTTALQQDGKIIIGGSFTDYNGAGRNNVARIFGDDVVTIDETMEENAMIIYPNPSNGAFTIEVERIGEILILDNLGRLILKKKINHNKESINLTNMNSGIYFLKLTTDHQQLTKKIIISK
jgi:uncharacterized delta-60 repeat protein